MLYCIDENIEMALEEKIRNINEKTKKDLKFYKDMEKDGRKLMEY
jgi:hypothetical protein